MTDKVNPNNNDSLKIGRFKFDNFPENSAIVMIAKRGSGKSWLVREILEYFKDIPVGAIICPSEIDSPFYSNFFSQSFIHYKYDPKILGKIFWRQKKIQKKYEDYLEKGKKLDRRCIIVMDDCMACKKTWVNDELIKTVLMNGRHKQMTYVLTMQYPLGVTPDLRSNFDIIFMMAADEMKFMKLLYENYAGIFDTFESFRSVFQQLTRDHGAMVVVKRTNTDADFYDKIKWYKARYRDKDEVNNVKIGCSQFRKFHERNYNPKWNNNENASEIDDEFFLRGAKKDYNAIFKDAKKNKQSININKAED